MASTREIKRTLARRVEAITQPGFLDRRVAPCLGVAAGAARPWETRIVQLDGTGAATVEIRCGPRRAFAKLYPAGEGRAVYDRLRRLREAGFDGRGRYRSVEPLGFFPEYDMLLTAAAEGEPVAAHIGGDEAALAAGAREAAVWLARLHTAPVRIGPARGLLESGELLALARRLAKLMTRRPEHLALALAMIEALERLAAETREGLFVQSHGQYRPIHVFVDAAAVTVIDLDRSHPADPARDVAEFLHRLRTTTFWRTGSVRAAEGATRAFLTTYAAHAGDGRFLANLRFHWARSIFHSLNHKLKDAGRDGGETEPVVGFYRSEFDGVLSGRIGF
ncbi:MAG TPA: phosphotransferase [Thermodesulfobacteriota bacterium]|nr:phosphotransferase [Thermodesulfobacteriota bacterium]